MRLRAFGFAAASILAVGGAAVTTGVQHAFAACPNGSDAQVYRGAGTSQIGAGSNSTVLLGVCVSTGNATFDGGWLEVGQGTGSNAGQYYAVIQGSQSNTCTGNCTARGYAGLSNYETGGKSTGPQDATPPCNSTNGGTDTNSGGSYGVKELCAYSPIFANGVTVPTTAVPLPVCGNQSGDTWSGTSRDGCWIV